MIYEWDTTRKMEVSGEFALNMPCRTQDSVEVGSIIHTFAA